MGKKVYVVTEGQLISTTRDGIFQDEYNIVAAYLTSREAMDHINGFAERFKASDIYPNFSWSCGNYLPVSDPEKGLGKAFTAIKNDSDRDKVTVRLYCQYEEVEIREESENGSTSGDDRMA